MLLQSVVMDNLWFPDKAMEGDVETTAGVHAWKTMRQAHDYTIGPSAYVIAVGTIKMWGEVVEHCDGWRAQYAKVNSIDFLCGRVVFPDAFDFPDAIDGLQQLRRTYGCED